MKAFVIIGLFLFVAMLSGCTPALQQEMHRNSEALSNYNRYNLTRFIGFPEIFRGYQEKAVVTIEKSCLGRVEQRSVTFNGTQDTIHYGHCPYTPYPPQLALQRLNYGSF